MTRTEYVKWLRSQIHQVSMLKVDATERRVSTYDVADGSLKSFQERLEKQLDLLEEKLTDEPEPKRITGELRPAMEKHDMKEGLDA